ncbi:1-(5-phosphoribosyl)-5-[(5-phosphoribosylamino)methylideneamino]imidazole-4-carboxamide isomerase [Sneathiella marina]|uniref:1-(5-phosphoribosyl)-5-[(5-phosphoribosylamino)methylideneamino] imidazole-4-carboxamide isomerase n=1 Tax=Sneathiella marina TaxID=2950108 RepID=A0ABY4W1V7_9PROT|nr:1-(5-phosphoribosyl)-5-[(5-phosphoribosylamino)methylideneamino]imidazole-4-carboxamide isomerase [Sneathiella marina]USG61160.1 1-(5-phosphoribosyl)-5-[(5-phosphoribosylamino)methylideneamino]imidazole-4-carboxamide isomerase [Sneathiella marina]
MNIYPAIDLKDGNCVRLLRGEMDAATIFNNDPADQARSFKDAGFNRLHLVDLNGAFEGKPVNASAVENILSATDVPVQLGGGIRDLATIDMWLQKGLKRVILGTVALRDPAMVVDACRAFPGHIAVGIDARDGRVAVEGWAETSETTALDLARKFEDVGVEAIIYTDIDRDGALQGVNLEATRALADAINIPVIASGGVASIADIEGLLTHTDSGIEGVIIGRALYDGRIDPGEAMALVRGEHA